VVLAAAALAAAALSDVEHDRVRGAPGLLAQVAIFGEVLAEPDRDFGCELVAVEPLVLEVVAVLPDAASEPGPSR
jgi:hypothetical protein